VATLPGEWHPSIDFAVTFQQITPTKASMRKAYYNVYPKEVETVIDAIDGVAESAVVGVPHPDFGEGVVAVVLRRPGRTDVGEAGVIAVCKEQLANYKVPKRVFFMDELPRNAMGKVQKNLLRDQHKDLFSTMRQAG
jgi:malonyl-CoA/methylmalonyl-CoA synthetase